MEVIETTPAPPIARVSEADMEWFAALFAAIAQQAEHPARVRDLARMGRQSCTLVPCAFCS